MPRGHLNGKLEIRSPPIDDWAFVAADSEANLTLSKREVPLGRAKRLQEALPLPTAAMSKSLLSLLGLAMSLAKHNGTFT
jgi:hypothetical protein